MRFFSVMLAACSLISIGHAQEASVEFEQWYMFEEWYDWHSREEFSVESDGALRVEVHFVGPGANTPRAVYVRTPKDADWSKVQVALDNERGNPLKPECTPLAIPGVPVDKKWVRLGTNDFIRGFSDLIFKGEDGVPPFDYALVSPNERYLVEGRADRWIRDYEAAGRKFSGVIRCGMPMGGVGAGKVEIARDGSFRNLTTNNNVDAPFYHPEGCFMAVAAGGEGRILRSEGAFGLSPIRNIEFEARYPIANLRFHEDGLPVDVQLTAWSPIIPGDVEDSSLPAAVLDFVLTNQTRQEIDAAVAVSWENLLGSTGRPQPGNLWGKTGHYLRVSEPAGNTQEVLSDGALNGLHFRGYNKREKDAEGNYTLAVEKSERLTVTYAQGYDGIKDKRDWRDFSKTGAFNNSTGSEQGGAIAIRVRLGPGEAVKIPVVFTWFMEHFYQMGAEDMGHYYANRFQDSREVARYVLAAREPLLRKTRALHELFDSSTLPEWLTDTILNDAYVFSTDTWLTKDGRFTVNEGATNMYGVMGTLDQKLYASQFYALFFPELQKRELLSFARLQNANGWMTHDVGCGRFAESIKAFDWPDLNSSFIILSYQMLQTTGDLAFWNAVFPWVDKALESLGTNFNYHQDKIHENYGIPGGGSTFDDEDSYPLFSYHAGLYLCNLKLGLEWARRMGDTERVRVFQERFDKARATAMQELYNGRFFVYGSDPASGKKSTSSHFSQLAGDYFAGLLGTGDLFDPLVRDSSLDWLLTAHGNPKFALPPKIVTGEGDLFPRSGPHRAAPVSWPLHARPMICGNAFYYGRAKEGWELLKRMNDNYRAANGPDPWDQSLYYDPLTGKLDWGIFYMTGPASWLAFQALAGVDYEADTARLRVRPAIAEIDPRAKMPVFSPLYWALLQCEGTKDLTLDFKRVSGGVLALREIVMKDITPSPEISLDGTVLKYQVQNEALVFDTPLTIKSGQSLRIKM